MFTMVASLLLSFFLVLGNAHAVPNPTEVVYSFEQPSPDPGNPFWPFTVTEGTQVAVIESAIANDSTTYSATHGNKFLIIGAGNPITSVEATFTDVVVGSLASMDLAFLGAGSVAKNDTASIWVNGNKVWEIDIVTCGGDNADCPWSTHSFLTSTETITISAEVMNAVNFSSDSELLVDNIRVDKVFEAPPVPEAETWAMILVGLGLVGLQARRHRRPSPVA